MTQNNLDPNGRFPRPRLSAATAVGRVGALAVALGIGVAVANAPAIAHAETAGCGDTQDSAPPRGAPQAGAKPAVGAGSPSALRGARSGLTRLRQRAEARQGDGRTIEARDPDGHRSTTNSRRPVLGGQAALSQPGGAETPNPQNQMRFDSIDSQRNSTLFSTVRSVHIRSGRAADTDPDADGAPRMPRREETVVSAMLGWARRQIGHQVTDKGATTSGAQPIASREWVETTRADMAMNSVSQSPLGNPDQLAAEERANKIVASPVVKLAELVLKMAWLATASRQYARVGGPDAANLAQIDKAVHEYAVMAALEQQSLDPNNPT